MNQTPESGTVKKEVNNHVQAKNNIETYGKVVLTLKNCILPEEKLSPTPSQVDGLDVETETDLRILGCELMQTAGILLKLPQVSYILFFLVNGGIIWIREIFISQLGV